MKGNTWLVPFLIGNLTGAFVVAMVFIPRFRTGFIGFLKMLLDGLDKLLSVKKKPAKPPAKFGALAKPPAKRVRRKKVVTPDGQNQGPTA
jgi:hypothetical protein